MSIGRCGHIIVEPSAAGTESWENREITAQLVTAAGEKYKNMKRLNKSLERKYMETVHNDMLNKLHMEMIRLYSGDPQRIQHFCKVHSYAKLIANMENTDEKTLYIIETAALTHDIGIHYCEEKYGSSNGKLQEKEGPAIARELLTKLGYEEDVISRVEYLIAHHHTYNDINGIDYQILVEADFLVNILEDNIPREHSENVYKNIFKTETGRTICRNMFNLH